MADAADRPADLVIHGLPQSHSLSTRAQLARLRLHWRLHASATAAAPPEGRAGLVERLYRAIDRRLFDRGRWRVAAGPQLADGGLAGESTLHMAWHRGAARTDGHSWCVEYEGLPMSRLDDAVRLRLGQPGGMLHARVWLLRPGHAPLLQMTGRLALDHRSLYRSMLLCAAKLPNLLQGAQARQRLQASPQPVLADSANAPMPVPRLLWRMVAASIDWLLWRGQWQLEVGGATDGVPGPSQAVNIIRPPRTGYWADPFFLRHAGRLWLLFEELPYATDRGRIGAIEIDASGRPTGPARTVLEEPWHLSYPFVWQEGARSFMLPEAGDSGELTLYEAVGDDLQWRRCATLLSGVRLVDASVVAYRGRLWMFAGSADYGTSVNDVLHIYWAERIEGPWQAHALNPVKIDASGSRPAGAMWVHDGQLYRTTQDCSSAYGGGIRCMRVLRLSEDTFEEEPVPGWAAAKAGQAEPWHTFNAIDTLNVVDRLVRLPRWRP